MSICSEIESLGVDGLHCLMSLTTGDETVRTIYISTEIWGVVHPPFSDDPEGRLHAELRQTLDAFLEGSTFTIATDPYVKPSDAMIARVDPIGEEIWDIRVIVPRSGIRVLGGFWSKDVFVALTWDYRENYDNASQWRSEINRCLSCWRDKFGVRPPLKGTSLNEYLTSYVSV